MTQQIMPISVTQKLIQDEPFAFNRLTISTMFGLDKFQEHPCTYSSGLPCTLMVLLNWSPAPRL